ncbi:MAG TPA: hypothetical protein VMR70_01145 [Flavisolibacter sp.]|nr:hypothetical protein [Flavisolibacter sp.]
MENPAKKVLPSGVVSDKAARWIASKLISAQRGFADFMAARTVGLSKRSVQVGLLLFCLCFGGLSVYVLSDVFRKRFDVVNTIKPDQLAVPKHYMRADPMPLPVITRKELAIMSQFRKYMDSLMLTPEGKQTYDSVLKVRPHLLDSIRLIESYYQSP